MKWNTKDYRDGRFVALDDNSGGYPFDVEKFNNAVEIWQSLEKALEYQKMFEYLNIYELTISLNIVKSSKS